MKKLMRSTRNKNLPILIALILVAAGAIYYAMRPDPLLNNNPPAQSGDWKTYRESNEWFGFSVEYPNDWDVAGPEASGEAGTRVYFYPRESNRSPEESIALLLINPRLTPALPVFYTYTAIRTVHGASGDVKIQTRNPGTPGEYIAMIAKGEYRAEFHFGYRVNQANTAIFDRIVSSFRFTK